MHSSNVIYSTSLWERLRGGTDFVYERDCDAYALLDEFCNWNQVGSAKYDDVGIVLLKYLCRGHHDITIDR